MRLSLFLLSTLFFWTVASFASSVTVMCTPPGPTMVATEQAQCSVQSPAGGLLLFGSAHASLGLDLATDPAAFSVLRTAQAASVQVTYDPSLPSGLGAAANTRIHFDEFLLTAGPVRPGYVILQSFGSDFISSEYGNGGVDFYFQGNSVNTHITCIAEDRACSPSNQILARFLPLIPISLGTPLELVAQGEVGAAGTNASGDETSGRASVTAWYEFRFVEADGVTPAAVTLAPEPSTARLLGSALCGVTLLGLGAWVQRRLC